MLRDDVAMSVTEGDHTPHRQIGRSHRMSGFHCPKPVAAGVRVGRAVRRLRVVMSEVRLNGSHLDILWYIDSMWFLLYILWNGYFPKKKS